MRVNYNINNASSKGHNRMILAHLEAGKTITSLKAAEYPFYCMRLSGRIWDLRHKYCIPIKGRTIVVGPEKKRVTEYYLEHDDKK